MSSQIEAILNKAKWAPSGDNEQAWRIKIISANTCDVTSGYFLESIFHLNRHSDHIALGCFIENFHLAAKESGFDVGMTEEIPAPGKAPVYHLTLLPKTAIAKDPLSSYIEQRSVNRFPYALKALTFEQKQIIERNLPLGYKMMWFDGALKTKFATLVFKAAALRYLIPEMFDIHGKIIDWKNAQSPDKIPSLALGMPAVFLPVMKWMLGKEGRMATYNKLMSGHHMTALKLEFLPMMMSSGGIAIIADKEPQTPQDWVSAGRAIQRFWLTATSLGLSHQPAYTAFVFSKHAEENRAFSSLPNIVAKAQVIRNDFNDLVGGEAMRRRLIWLGRIGFARPRTARSLRRPINEAMLHNL